MSKEIKEAIQKRRDLINLDGLNFHQVEAQLNILLGKVLTIIDSSICEQRQNKATKDLVKNMFYEQVRMNQYKK
tara:strand:- start:864 stop:1085 length:222 start_codon:yes stop_codon:yes gene_type:complete